MRVRFHPDARREYVGSIKHYENVETGLGKRLVDSIEAGIESIVSHPQAWPQLTGPVRKRVVAVFPYTILYVPSDNEIYVVAIMHQSRHPKYWTSRLS